VRAGEAEGCTIIGQAPLLRKIFVPFLIADVLLSIVAESGLRFTGRLFADQAIRAAPMRK
jgi:hypothetical protein